MAWRVTVCTERGCLADLAQYELPLGNTLEIVIGSKYVALVAIGMVHHGVIFHAFP